MYFYKSPVGVFWIRPTTDRRFVLGFGHEIIGVYYTPVAAADDVYVHVTGCTEWDMLDGKVDGPTDLSEWDKSE